MSLTIVYSTRHPVPEFVEHLQQTCGWHSLEILAYPNSGNNSLSQIYNQGLNQASNDFIVFLHDDVIFESDHWGQQVVQHLQDSEFGILGVAGTAHLPTSGIWWQDRLKTIGVIKHQAEGKTWRSKYSGDFKDRILPAVAIDGVFMAVNRIRLQEGFNETLTGFHFYDIDFCLNNYLAGVKIGVIFNVPLIHKSLGQTSEAWEYHRAQFLATHKYNLPCSLKCTLVFDNQPLLKLSRFPKVSVIILHKSKNFLLFNCLNSWAEKSNYPNYEIIIADTGSSQPELAEIYEWAGMTTINVKVVKFQTYHFASVNNEVVFNHCDADSELILFCNNDIELINDALTRMVQVYLENNTHCGTVGCRLHFADNTIQHAGIQLLMKSEDQLQVGHKGFRSYYHYEADGVEAGITGSTAAFLLISKVLFQKINGFNRAYQQCLEDVELNLACLKHNKINYLVNDAVCYHFESQTRQEKGVLTGDDYGNLLKFLSEHSDLVRKYITRLFT